MQAGTAIKISAAQVSHVEQILVPKHGRKARAPHEAEHVAFRHITLAVKQTQKPRQHLSQTDSRFAIPVRVEVLDAGEVLHEERSESQFHF